MVEGQALGDFVAGHELDLGQRLEVFIKIAGAVHHAHQKGVMHRDLKPSNILVTGQGQPKILDFGVARTLDSDVDATQHTEVGQIIGTLTYMSPEQVSGDPAAIDIRSDVYSRGLVLYQLVAEHLPYEFTDRSVPHAVRIITEQEITPLRTVQPNIEPDLDVIASKALEKDKQRRYDSAAALAEDIQRLLRKEPISARPPSTIYQLRKFAHRNRAVAVGLSVAVMGLVVGLLGTSWQAYRASQAQSEAEIRGAETLQEAQSVEAVNEFLSDVLGTSDQYSRSAEFTVREALERAEQQIEFQWSGQPKVEAAVRVALASAYQHQGLLERAAHHFKRALALRRETYGDTHPKVGNTLNAIACLHVELGEDDQAERLFREVLEIYAMSDVREEWVATTQSNLGYVLYQGREFDEAESLFRESLETKQIILGEESLEVAYDLVKLARLLEAKGSREESKSYLWLAVDTHRSLAESTDMALAMSFLARLECQDENFEEAEELLREALEIRIRFLGNDHPEVQRTRKNLEMAVQRIVPR